MAEANAQMAALSTNGGTETKINSAIGTMATSGLRAMEEHPSWPTIARLPVGLGVNIPLRGFRVNHLLGLLRGQTIASQWAVTEDVPLEVGTLRICWGEFEVVEKRLALRLTRLV